MTDYYISSSLGADTNDGLTPTTAWAHHPWDANATDISAGITLVGGDVLRMLYGDSWYEVDIDTARAGSLGNLITTTAYGLSSLGQPALSGAIDPATLVWTQHTGNIWKATITNEPNVVYSGGIRLSENNGNFATLGANEWDWDTGTLYVNIGGDPGATIKTDYTPGNVLRVNQNYTAWKNLIFEFGEAELGGNIYCQSAGIQGFEIENVVSRYTAYDREALYIFTASAGVKINNLSIIESGSLYCRAADNIELTNFSIDSPGLVQAAIVIRDSDNMVGESISIAGGKSKGIQFLGSSQDNVIEKATISDVWNGSAYGAGGDGIGVAFEGTSQNNVVSGAIITDNYINVSNLSSGDNNLVIFSAIADARTNDVQFEGAGKMYCLCNTIAHNSVDPGTEGHAIVFQATGTKGYVAGNLVEVYNQEGDFVSINTIANITDVYIDNNAYWQVDNVVALWNATGTDVDFATWKAALAAEPDITGNDVNSEYLAYTDDSPAAHPSTGNYNLVSGSTLIDASPVISGYNDQGCIDYNGKYLHRLPNRAGDQGAGAPTGAGKQVSGLTAGLSSGNLIAP